MQPAGGINRCVLTGELLRRFLLLELGSNNAQWDIIKTQRASNRIPLPIMTYSLPLLTHSLSDDFVALLSKGGPAAGLSADQLPRRPHGGGRAVPGNGWERQHKGRRQDTKKHSDWQIIRCSEWMKEMSWEERQHISTIHQSKRAYGAMMAMMPASALFSQLIASCFLVKKMLFHNPLCVITCATTPLCW